MSDDGAIEGVAAGTEDGTPTTPNPADSMRKQLETAEAEEQQLQQELREAEMQVAEARDAGTMLMNAVEAAMAPLMEELTAARSRCPDVADLALLAEGGDPARRLADLESQVKHLELDIRHYQGQVETLQAEERQHSHEIHRLHADLEGAADEMDYEKRRHQHFEMKQQLASGGAFGGSQGFGPAGIGKRTMHAKAERDLREAAEQRASKLSRDVSRLASDTASQQVTIDALERRLASIRRSAGDQETRLNEAFRKTSHLQDRLRGQGSEDAPRQQQPLDAGSNIGAVSSSPSFGGEAKKKRLKKKSAGMHSTGRLPNLSF